MNLSDSIKEASFHFLATNTLNTKVKFTKRLSKYKVDETRQFGIDFDNNCVIKHLEKGTDAFEKLNVDDKIVAINGEPCESVEQIKRMVLYNEEAYFSIS